MAVSKHAAYCRCGASLTLRGNTTPPKAILELFWLWHVGAGHGAPPAAGARRARGPA